jgi:DGQHR domain-containing protein
VSKKLPRNAAKELSYRALLVVQNRRRFYFATIPIDKLFPWCFVSRRAEDPIKGFQRLLTESRSNDIAQYLSSGIGSIPSNIVLSAQDVANLKYDPRAGSISFTPTKGAFLVLDGQHRLWGYQKCSVRHRVPVAIYSGLTLSVEARLFIDINTTQRGVPAALLLDIKQLAEMESEKEQMLRELFDKLQVDSKSPLAGRLSAAKTMKDHLSRVTFNRSVGDALSSGSLLEANAIYRYKVILNYLNAFDAELSDKRVLVRPAFFEAIFAVFDEVVRLSLQKYNNLKDESFQEIIRPLARLNLSGTKKVLELAMAAALKDSVTLTEDMV